MLTKDKKHKIAFIVGTFPVISETFIINQIADLSDKGIEVDVFSFNKGSLENISSRFFDYKMQQKVKYLEVPNNKFLRIILAVPKIIHVLFLRPKLLFGIFNFKKYGRNSYSLKLLFYIEPFLTKQYDLIHCHFGKVANKYLIIREILEQKTKFITSFYGFDVSVLFLQKPTNYYDNLKKECSGYIVMSNNMKDRVVSYGFDANKIVVLPISIDVPDYPYQERSLKDNDLVNIISVGRFVEKKGFDDLLRAIAIVKAKAKRSFRLFIVGGGPLEDELKTMTKSLDIEDVVEYKGYVKIEDLIQYFLKMHLYVQPSKTARDGDME